MSLKRALIAGGGVTAALAVCMMNTSRGSRGVTTAPASVDRHEEERSVSESSLAPRAEISSRAEESSKAGAMAVAPKPADTVGPKLARFAGFERKFSLSESEKLERAGILADRDLLRLLGPKVMSFASTSAEIEEQDAALDVLLATLTEGDRHTGEYVLKEIVADPLMEDKTIALDRRKQRAGVVGEILYRWTAQSPDDKSGLVSSLPGEASRRVWQNVERMQNQNHDASVAVTENGP